MLVWETEIPFLDRYRAFVDILDAFPGTDLLIYTPGELDEMRRRSGFVEQAEREGRVLYDCSGGP